MEFLIILGNGYLVGGFIMLFYVLYWIIFGRFQRSRQFDGPAIVPLFGHYKDLQRHNFQLHLMIDEYYHKFGKLLSFHYQNTELKVVSESKMIHEILIKRFDKFCNRKVSKVSWILIVVQRCIQNTVKHLRWSVFLKFLTSKSH